MRFSGEPVRFLAFPQSQAVIRPSLLGVLTELPCRVSPEASVESVSWYKDDRYLAVSDTLMLKVRSPGRYNCIVKTPRGSLISPSATVSYISTSEWYSTQYKYNTCMGVWLHVHICTYALVYMYRISPTICRTRL